MSSLSTVSTTIAKRLVTKRNIQRAIGRHGKLDRCFYVCQKMKTKVELFYHKETPVFSISSPGSEIMFAVNLSVLKP